MDKVKYFITDDKLFVIVEEGDKYNLTSNKQKEVSVTAGNAAHLSWTFNKIDENHAASFKKFMLGVFNKLSQSFKPIVSVSETMIKRRVISKGRIVKWTGNLMKNNASFKVPRVVLSDEDEYSCIAEFTKRPTLIYSTTKLVVNGGFNVCWTLCF